MYLYRNLPSISSHATETPRVATIGVFDGLHLGHREILRQTICVAQANACPAIVCSFEPMPAEFFAPNDPPARLTRFRERFELLQALKIDQLFCPRFASVRDLGADEFIETFLVKALNLRHLVVGHDFQFGAGRSGCSDDLRSAGKKFGFGVSVMEPVFFNAERISSTLIRAALAKGNLSKARNMLGRDYSMSGRVVHGLGVGKNLGFPTANVNLKRRLAPVDGIFAVQISGITDHRLDGVASVGNRPMMGGGETLLEVFIFDFDRDIYGDYITVHFVARLREERSFADIDAMKEQIHLDVRDARAALTG